MTVGDLQRVLDHYRLGDLRAAQRAERGFVNENWIVETAQGRYLLKRRHPRLCQPDLIRAQHQLIGWLRRAGFPAPSVVPNIDGQTSLVLDGEMYEIQGYIEGEPYEHGRLAHLEEAGLTLGRYHCLVEGCAPQALCRLGPLYGPSILSRLLIQLTETWQLNLDAETAGICRELESEASDLAERFAGNDRLSHLVIHGDYYADNLIFEGDRIIGVVDYDKASWQPQVAELAEALIYFSSQRPGHLRYLVYQGFLDWEPFFRFVQSYGRGTDLQQKEIGALPDYVRCIWLCVSLKRLLQKGPRPVQASEALQEVLELACWGRVHAGQMVEATHSAMSGG